MALCSRRMRHRVRVSTLMRPVAPFPNSNIDTYHSQLTPNFLAKTIHEIFSWGGRGSMRLTDWHDHTVLMLLTARLWRRNSGVRFVLVTLCSAWKGDGDHVTLLAASSTVSKTAHFNFQLRKSSRQSSVQAKTKQFWEKNRSVCFSVKTALIGLTESAGRLMILVHPT